MTKITQFDRTTCRILEKEIIAALGAVANKHGLTVEAGGGTFDDHKFTAKVRFAPHENDEERKARERDEFAKYAPIFGLRAEDYGKTFTSKGKSFKLVGIEPQRPKFPFVAERVADGKRFKFVETVTSKFRNEAL